MCRCLESRQVGEEARDHEQVQPDEAALGEPRARAVTEEVRERPGKRRRPRRPLVQAGGDAGGVPEQEADDDGADQREDEVGLAAVTAGEAGRAQELADREARSRRRPPRAARRASPPPRTSPAHPARAGSRCGRRRRSAAIRIVGKRTMKPQKMAACMSPGPSRCSSLRWPSTLGGLAAQRALRARRRARAAPPSPAGARRAGRGAAASAAADEQQRGKAERAGEDGYAPRTRLSSALIAGTTSCRSPMTA